MFRFEMKSLFTTENNSKNNKSGVTLGRFLV